MATKQGNPADRLDCARFARDARAKFPTLQGSFTRREWNFQVLVAAHNRLARLTLARKAYAGPVLVSDSGLAALEPTPVDVREFDVVQGGAT